jgi:hypothetical protein
MIIELGSATEQTQNTVTFGGTDDLAYVWHF